MTDIATFVVLALIWTGSVKGAFASANKYTYDQPFYLSFENETAQKAVDALSKESGILIEIVGSLDPQPISLMLNGENLVDALERILRGYNYAVIYVNDGSLSILMFDDRSTRNSTVTNVSRPRTTSKNGVPLPSYADDELLPAEEGGPLERLADVRTKMLSHKADPIVDVIPPSDGELLGWDETGLARQRPQDSYGIDALPPEIDRDFGQDDGGQSNDDRLWRTHETASDLVDGFPPETQPRTDSRRTERVRGPKGMGVSGGIIDTANADDPLDMLPPDP